MTSITFSLLAKNYDDDDYYYHHHFVLLYIPKIYKTQVTGQRLSSFTQQRQELISFGAW